MSIFLSFRSDVRKRFFTERCHRVTMLEEQSCTVGETSNMGKGAISSRITSRKRNPMYQWSAQQDNVDPLINTDH